MRSRNEGGGMGIFDKAKDAFGKNKAKIEAGIDKTADFAKDNLADKHDAKVDKAADFAKDTINKLDK
jgi:hypothetical protein